MLSWADDGVVNGTNGSTAAITMGPAMDTELLSGKPPSCHIQTVR